MTAGVAIAVQYHLGILGNFCRAEEGFMLGHWISRHADMVFVTEKCTSNTGQRGTCPKILKSSVGYSIPRYASDGSPVDFGGCATVKEGMHS